MNNALPAPYYLSVLFMLVLSLPYTETFSKEQSSQTLGTEVTPSKEHALLVKGRAQLQKGSAQKAINDSFDPIIGHYKVAYKDTTKHIYSAQNRLQMIIYVALPDDNHVGTEVLDGTWADAYLLKAYALTELGKIKDAQEALNSAIALSPMNSQYLSELAYTYQQMKDCDKSIATYDAAASMAELGSEEATKTADLTRAWRGKGFCLVEQGKLTEAEQMYQKSLALDPNDSKSKGELNYVRNLKK